MKYYDPKHIHLWTMPPHYAGETWPCYYNAGVGQSRDSQPIEQANFQAMAAELETIPEPKDWGDDDPPWQIVRESHWLVGWVEWIAIHQDSPEHVRKADELIGSLEDYPVLDDDLLSEIEWQWASDVWANCYDDRERLEMIRDRIRHTEYLKYTSYRELGQAIKGEYAHAAQFVETSDLVY